MAYLLHFLQAWKNARMDMGLVISEGLVIIILHVKVTTYKLILLLSCLSAKPRLTTKIATWLQEAVWQKSE